EMLNACEERNLRLMTFDQLLSYLGRSLSPSHGERLEERERDEIHPCYSYPLPSDGRGIKGEGFHSQLYLGIDVARKNNLCVLDVGEKLGDVTWDRIRIELQNKPFAEIKFELYRLLRLPQLKRCCIDATG